MATDPGQDRELRNISDGPRGGITPRETQPSAQHHRKGGNSFIMKKNSTCHSISSELILLENYHIIVPRLLEKRSQKVLFNR